MKTTEVILDQCIVAMANPPWRSTETSSAVSSIQYGVNYIVALGHGCTKTRLGVWQW